jgi:hypothetical protein
MDNTDKNKNPVVPAYTNTYFWGPDDAKDQYRKQLQFVVNIGLTREGAYSFPFLAEKSAADKDGEAAARRLAMKKDKASIRASNVSIGTTVSTAFSALMVAIISVFTFFSTKQPIPPPPIRQDETKDGPPVRPDTQTETSGAPPHFYTMMEDVTKAYPKVQSIWSSASTRLEQGTDPVTVKQHILYDLDSLQLALRLQDIEKPGTYNEKGEKALNQLISAFESDNFVHWHFGSSFHSFDDAKAKAELLAKGMIPSKRSKKD